MPFSWSSLAVSSEALRLLLAGSSEARRLLLAVSSEALRLLLAGSSEARRLLLAVSSEARRLLLAGSSEALRSVFLLALGRSPVHSPVRSLGLCSKCVDCGSSNYRKGA